jgi:hypothetical protein
MTCKLDSPTPPTKGVGFALLLLVLFSLLVGYSIGYTAVLDTATSCDTPQIHAPSR